MHDIMCSVVGAKDMVTFDFGMNMRGDPVYRISWYKDGKWAYARYKTFKPAYATWRMISRMV